MTTKDDLEAKKDDMVPVSPIATHLNSPTPFDSPNVRYFRFNNTINKKNSNVSGLSSFLQSPSNSRFTRQDEVNQLKSVISTLKKEIVAWKNAYNSKNEQVRNEIVKMMNQDIERDKIYKNIVEEKQKFLRDIKEILSSFKESNPEHALAKLRESLKQNYEGDPSYFEFKVDLCSIIEIIIQKHKALLRSELEKKQKENDERERETLAKLEELRRTIDKIPKDDMKYKQQLHDVQKRYEVVVSELQMEKEKTIQLVAQLDHKNQICDELQQDVLKKQEEFKRINKRLEMLSEQFTKERQSHLEKIEKMNNDIERLKNEKLELERRLRRQEEMHDFEKQSLKRQFELEFQQKADLSFSQVQKEYDESLEQMRDRLKQSEKVIEMQRKTIENMKLHIQNNENNEKFQHDFGLLMAQLRNLFHTVFDSDSETVNNLSCYEMLEVLSTKFRNMKKELHEVRLKLHEIKHENIKDEEYLAEIANLRNTIKQYEELTHNLKSEMEERIKADTIEREGEQRKYKMNISYLQSQLEALREENQHLKQQLESCMADLENKIHTPKTQSFDKKVEEAIEEYKTQFDEERKRDHRYISELQKIIQLKSSEKSSMQEIHNRQISELMSDIESLRQTNAKLKERLALYSEGRSDSDTQDEYARHANRKVEDVKISQDVPQMSQMNVPYSTFNLSQPIQHQTLDSRHHYPLHDSQISRQSQEKDVPTRTSFNQEDILLKRMEHQKSLEMAIQRLIEERNALKEKLENIDQLSNVNMATLPQVAQSLQNDLEQNRRRQEEMENELQKERLLNAQLLKKYRTVKNKFLKQTLHQNQIQNYLLRMQNKEVFGSKHNDVTTDSSSSTTPSKPKKKKSTRKVSAVRGTSEKKKKTKKKSKSSSGIHSTLRKR